MVFNIVLICLFSLYYKNLVDIIEKLKKKNVEKHIQKKIRLIYIVYILYTNINLLK